jgi:hypothetical protein
MRYDVPFISQFTDITNSDWQWRSCGIAALKMVLDYWHACDSFNRTVDVDELHRIGIQESAYRPGIGWTHAGLAAAACRLGYTAYNRDWAEQGPTPKDEATAWHLTLEELTAGPVLVSVYSGFERSRGGGHIAVLTGHEDEVVFLNDPEQQCTREGVRVLALRSFLKAFKYRIIVVRPNGD